MDLEKEREAFEKHASKFFTDSKEAFKTNDDQYLYDEVIWMWDCWIERAKAQAVPEPSINMTSHDLKYIWDFMDYADPENLDTEVTIQLCREGFDGAGLYAWVAEYPEEGGIKLCEAQEPAND